MIIPPVPVPLRPVSLAEVVDSEVAYTEMDPAFAAVTEEQLMVITLDFPSTTMQLLDIHGRVMPLLPQAKEEITHFNPETIEKMPVRAMALQHAHTLYLAAKSPDGDDPVALQESGNALRLRLHADASYMVKRGFLDKESIDSVKFQTGYRTTATDLMVLVTAVRRGSLAAAGKIIVEEDDLTSATSVANRLFVAVPLRKQNSRGVAHTTLRRHQAYTYVVREYDYVRRVVNFLRWEQGDADDFAPSLFANRGTTSRKSKSDAPPAPATPTKEDSSPAAPVGGSPVAPVGGSPVAPAKGEGETKVPTGHEGGSPFIGG